MILTSYHTNIHHTLQTINWSEVNPSSISLFVNPSDSMQSGVHESLVGFRFVQIHVFLVPSPNFQIAQKTLVPSHTFSTLVGAYKLVFMKA